IAARLLGYDAGIDLSIPFVYLPDPSNTVSAFYYFYKSGDFVAVLACSFAVGWVSYSQVLAYLNTRKFFNLLFASLMLVGIFLSI
ncbi:hypothetical protein, partial [Cereibacter changlensis]|uniref:hypothetical protein n=1 Tax=Cereibacter changlensis TaxID=402884 RepID=UPI001B80863E